MEGKNRFSTFGATSATASIFGALAGLGGLNHGIGETLQGNVAAGGIIVNSWTVGPIAANMGGEPAMTLAPSLLVAGILTITLSLAVTVWSVAFVRRKNGGLIQLLLSIAMLLVGGGFAPPVVAILASVAGIKIHSSYGWWRAHLPVARRRFLARLWPWLFAVCVINGVFLTIGSVVLVYLIGLNAPNLFVISFLFGVVSLISTIVIGFAYDIEKGVSPQPTP
jgi:hypothetical protein